jgi:glucan phosphorylase
MNILNILLQPWSLIVFGVVMFLKSYCQAHEERDALYADPDAWARKAILNVASSGKENFQATTRLSNMHPRSWRWNHAQ